MELGELSFFGSPNKVLVTENTNWVVPIGVKNIWITACASGEDGSSTDNTYRAKAGDYCIKEHFSVKQGQQIPITVGDGNTIVGEYIKLIKGVVQKELKEDILGLGYNLGYNGYAGTNGAEGGAPIHYSGGGTAESLAKYPSFRLVGTAQMNMHVATGPSSYRYVAYSCALGGRGGVGGYGGAFGIGGAGGGGGGGGGAAGLTATPVDVNANDASGSTPYYSPIYGPASGAGGGGGGFSYNGQEIPSDYKRNINIPMAGLAANNSVVNHTIHLRPTNSILTRKLTEFEVNQETSGVGAKQDLIDEFSIDYSRKKLAGIINLGEDGEYGELGYGTAKYYTYYDTVGLTSSNYRYRAVPVVNRADIDSVKGGKGGKGGNGGDSIGPIGWGAGGGSCGESGTDAYDLAGELSWYNSARLSVPMTVYNEKTSATEFCADPFRSYPELRGEQGKGGKGGVASKGAPGMVLIEW